MKNEINNKEKLIEYLSFIRDKETEKPINEADNDLIEACVELLLELQGKKVTLSTEQIEERVRKIPFVDTATFEAVNTKGKVRKQNKKKILLIAAVIAILVALLSIVSIAFEWNIFDEVKSRFGLIANVPVGVEQQEDGITFKRLGKERIYQSVEECFEKEHIDVLIPKWLPDNSTINTIAIFEVNGSEEIYISFTEKELNCLIYTCSDFPIAVIEDKNNKTFTINGMQCYIVDMKDVGVTQIYFVHNKNCYRYTYTNKQVLLEIIENLEEK